MDKLKELARDAKIKKWILLNLLAESHEMRLRQIIEKGG